MRSIRGSADVDATLLQVDDLHIAYPNGRHKALGGVGFEVARGQRIGIVGESGSGKSQLLLSVIGLLPAAANVAGSVRLEGRELIGLGERDFDALRGATIGMIFQDPMTALNPYLRIGTQLTEVLIRHRNLRATDAVDAAVAMLDRLSIPDARSRMQRFPHEFSGGMRQRVVIAMALLCEPRLVLADEPTTALDVTVQAQVLDLLVEGTERSGSALLMVTHDLGVVARTCEHVIVLFGGRVMESGPIRPLYADPRHPYTIALLAAVPRLDAPVDRQLAAMAEPLPVDSDADAVDGCPFAVRCPLADAHCRAVMPVRHFAGARSLACHKAVL